MVKYRGEQDELAPCFLGGKCDTERGLNGENPTSSRYIPSARSCFGQSCSNLSKGWPCPWSSHTQQLCMKNGLYYNDVRFNRCTPLRSTRIEVFGYREGMIQISSIYFSVIYPRRLFPHNTPLLSRPSIHLVNQAHSSHINTFIYHFLSNTFASHRSSFRVTGPWCSGHPVKHTPSDFYLLLPHQDERG